MIRIVIDSREKAPFKFKEARCAVSALETGDYQLRGDEAGLVIERKSLEDLFGTVSAGLPRFTRELERLSRCAFPVLLVEATPRQLEYGARYSGANGSRVIDHALALCIAYGVTPMFCDGRLEAERMAWRLLKARHEVRTRRKN